MPRSAPESLQRGFRRGGAAASAVYWAIPALAGVLGVAVARVVGLKLSQAAEWPLLFVTFAATSALMIRMRAERAYRPVSVLQALRSLATGNDLDMGALKREGLGEDLLASIGELSGSVKALRGDKLRAEMVLSEIADGIITVDGTGKVALFNRAAESMLGEKAARVMGRDLESADLHPELARLAADCLTGEGPYEAEIRLPGLPERVVGIRAARFSELGHGSSALLLLRDLSDIRRHEKMQKEFVSNVSHELRTPITAVRVTAEALLAGAKDDEDLVDRFLNNIVAESDRLSALIDDLMEIAKRESGITMTEKTEVGLVTAIERAYMTVRPQAEQNGISVELQVAADLTAYADETQFVQMIRNLLDNAVKYSSAGGQVTVSAARTHSGVEIATRDTGIGIPHGEVDRIFERFYRVDKARSRRIGGTGLGLAIVKDIVDAHGGKIVVDTELGKGSTFTVTLPAGDG